jgi:hypothetical protein
VANDRLSNLESRVEELSQRLSGLERRVSALDRKEVAAPAPSVAAPAPESEFGAVFSLVGRTLLALGGAYLLRALTEAGVLPQIAGASLAAVYAGFWIVLADRAATAGKPASAAFHIVSAVLVGCPLLWETTVRLHLLGTIASASALVVVAVAILAVARRHELEPGAWVGLVAAELTAVALLFGTRAVAPFVAALVAIGLAALVLWETRRAPLAWAGAVVADLAVGLLTFGALIQSTSFSIAATLAVQLTLFLGYVGIFFRRNVIERKEATVFEMSQGGASTLIGYGGAAVLADSTRALALVLVVGLAGAIAGYGAAFRPLSSAGEGRTRIFFSALALSIILFATGTSLAQPAWLWSILAALAFALARRIPAPVLSLHGSVYLVAAAAAAGLVQFSIWALSAPAATSWPSLSPASLVVLAAALASTVLGVPEAHDWGPWAHAPRVLALGVTLLGLCAGAMLLLSPVAGADAARLAVLRTAVLSVASVGLAAVSSRARIQEAAWLSYGVLGLCGIKLVVEDFPRGRPLTLFLGLGFYGAALILAPRLARRPS